MSVLHDPDLEQRLAALHARSDGQLAAMKVRRSLPDNERKLTPEEEAARTKHFLSDKLVALDRDKAEFCYQLLRSINAHRAVEIGTSYGVSTLYLAAALRDNVQGTGDTALVIGTEHEPGKAAAARAEFGAAGLAGFIQLLEGDLRDTLKSVTGPIDFVLVDIWIPMARPALELVTPRLRPGAIVICDNTEAYRTAYADYFAFIDDPASGFSTMTLPFAGGLEMSGHNAPRTKALDRWRNQASK